MSKTTNSCRVFISYRGKTEGEAFGKRLFDYLTSRVSFAEQKFGKTYYSLISDPTGNFKKDIPDLMRDAEYFVLPLTEGFFNDFLNEDGEPRKEHSITYRELNEAFDKKDRDSDSIRFICVKFPGYSHDKILLNKLFQKRSDYIIGAKLIDYEDKDEIEIFRMIADEVTRDDFYVPGINAHSLLSKIAPNVSLSFKEYTENPDSFPLYNKLYDVTHITVMNFAATSLISGIDVAGIYKQSDDLKRLFMEGLATGRISADLVLTDPHSFAALDAEQYKMFPRNQTIESERIIIHNLNKLFRFKRDNPKANLKISLTQASLPYGVMITTHKHSENDHIKVDMYAAIPGSDDYRPSFYMLESDPSTRALYQFFSDNVDKIKSYATDFSDGHPNMSWLLKKRIIHRGAISEHVKPHTYGAFVECIERGYPIEVDLLQLKDGTIIIGRDDEDITEYDFSGKLSDYDVLGLYSINTSAGRQNRKLKLDEFCDLIGDRIPVLFEVKVDNSVSKDSIAEYAKSVVSILRNKYRRSLIDDGKFKQCVQRFAIHSANPYVISAVKELDCTIPCGIISTDFSERKDVSEEYAKLHSELAFMEICQPDFINYDVRFLSNGKALSISKKYNIPLLAWTIKDENSQRIAENVYNCSNIIIEGKPTFITE